MKLKWTEYDLKNLNKATHEWLEAHKDADEIVMDKFGNPSHVVYLSPISQGLKVMKETPSPIKETVNGLENDNEKNT